MMYVAEGMQVKGKRVAWGSNLQCKRHGEGQRWRLSMMGCCRGDAEVATSHTAGMRVT